MGIHEGLLRTLDTVRGGLMLAGAWAALYAFHRILQRREFAKLGEADRREYRRAHACRPGDNGQANDGPKTPAGAPPPRP